jgi:hypothetical protein
VEADRARRAELLRALGRVGRSLSTLFWVVPLALMAEFETGRADIFAAPSAWSCAPAVALNAALFYGLGQMRAFQKQERIWQHALTRGEMLALINTGLSPFVFWWRRFPDVSYFHLTVGLLALTELLFLIQINRVLQRLTAMIPDEALRAETRVFSSLSIWLLAGVFLGLSAWFGANAWAGASAPAQRFLALARPAGLGAILFLTLFPLALTLALLWKIKEVVFAGIFNQAN